MSTAISTDITDIVVNQGYGVKGLIEMGLKGLPEQYLQPPEERFDLSKVVHEEGIPIIDVSDWDNPAVAESICNAAEKWGFFQIINHGVPIEVLENMKEAAHRFFGLPPEERRQYLKEYPPTGSVHLGTSFNPRVEKVLEWKDYLSLLYVPGDEGPPASWPSVCNWIPVKPISGSLVINIGDMLQIMSNGRYKSIEHYVSTNKGKNRVSVPIFVNPANDAVIGPLAEVLETGEKPIYKQVVFSDYYEYFFGKAHDGKETIQFAKI
ncbi:hypothetical protein L1049_018058 [Liquidambar formosana]|uniref:Uncharacterized protein n=1 Tax=Liquidambar formosana TaxID=63359 RepID=A0AAP0NK02_LIQFO